MFSTINPNKILIAIQALTVFCLVFFVSRPAPTMADTNPEINYAPSTIQNGQSITINGGGFGIKNPVEPLRYDDFESGVIGDRLAGQTEDTGWTTVAANGVFPRYSTVRQRIPGEQVAEQRYGLPPDGFYNQTIGLINIPIHRFYASQWVFRDDYNGNALLSDNAKLYGNFSRSEGNLFPQCRVDIYPSAGGGHLYMCNVEGRCLPPYAPDHGGIDASAIFSSTFGRWVRIERCLDAGSVGGYDAVSWIDQDFERIASISTSVGHGPLLIDDQTFDEYLFGHFFRTDGGATLKQYVGEMYVDYTQARIEIGNASTWETNTHREIQIPHTTWNESEIQFTANQGTFTDGESAYLYVVDGNGAVNAAGYPITFASANDCTPSWDCSDWSVCADSVQTRSCHDDNNCGTDAGRPIETAECDSTAPGTVADLAAA